uniref:Uncharacterized protein n=1 Tax=Octopus bimaculoides TaxID=37653 RepID=A0A0L8FHW0_OCTBM
MVDGWSTYWEFSLLQMMCLLSGNDSLTGAIAPVSANNGGELKTQQKMKPMRRRQEGVKAAEEEDLKTNCVVRPLSSARFWLVLP